MKKLFLSLFCLACLASCRNADAFLIEGRIDSVFEGCQIVLSHHDEELLSDTTVIKNGKFRFERAVDTSYMFDISTFDKNADADARFSKDRKSRSATVALEAGKIFVDMTAGDSKVGGTPLNDLWQSFLDKYESAGIDSITLFVIENSSNIVGKQAFFDNHQKFSEKDLQLMLEKTDTVFQNDKRVQLCINSNRIVRRIRMEDRQRANSLNVKYQDFVLETPDGGTKRISDYVGESKYLLIDFWATWCGPCIKGMPEMKMLYEKYRDKGVGMIGISLDDDNNRDHWRQVQAEIDTPWPQLGYLKGTDSDLANAFIVSDIPYVVIIDDTGTIVRYVRMPASNSNLAKVLEELIP